MFYRYRRSDQRHCGGRYDRVAPRLSRRSPVVANKRQVEMFPARERRSDLDDDLERFSTEELLSRAFDMDIFGVGLFSRDLRHESGLGKKLLPGIDGSRKGSDELFPNFSRNDRPPLPGDRRRSDR
jgi:hypothetical protein